MAISDIYWIDSKQDDNDYAEQKVRDIEELFSVSITIHDAKGALRLSNGLSVFRNRSSHENPYCLKGRYSAPSYDNNCLQHCQKGIHEQVLKSQKPFASLCWKGVREIIVPMYKNEIHFFTLFAGVFRDSKKDFPIEEILISKKIRQMHQELEVFDSVKAEKITRSLESLGLFLLNYIDQPLKKDGAINRKALIQNFILYHSHEDIKLEDLSKVLFLSSSRASHVIKEIYQKSFQEILIDERIKRTKILLLNSRRTIAQIAVNVGIKNEFYLSRLFKAKVGISPGRYRKTKGETS